MSVFPPRDVLSSSVAPAGPSQFCVPSQSGSSFVPNANMLNRLPGHFYPGMSDECVVQSVEPREQLWAV